MNSIGKFFPKAESCMQFSISYRNSYLLFKGKNIFLVLSSNLNLSCSPYIKNNMNFSHIANIILDKGFKIRRNVFHKVVLVSFSIRGGHSIITIFEGTFVEIWCMHTDF